MFFFISTNKEFRNPNKTMHIHSGVYGRVTGGSGHNQGHPRCPWELRGGICSAPAGFHVAANDDDTVLEYVAPRPKPKPGSADQVDVAAQVRRFSETSRHVNLLHNNQGSSLAPGMPVLTYDRLAESLARNPQRIVSSRSTQRRLRGVDQFRPDVTHGHGHGNAELPPVAISERHSAGAYHPSASARHQSRDHIADVVRY